MKVLNDPEEVARDGASIIAAAIRDGARTLALAGGTTPRRLYQLLSGLPVPWGRVTILFGDERCVLPDHHDSNYRAVRESLLDRVSPATVHRIPGELGPVAAAQAYAEVISAIGRIDMVLLGIGPDGHCASLFPGDPALEATGPVAGVTNSPKPPPERVTLTLPTMRAAGQVLILATGAEKRDAVAAAGRGEVPAGMIANATWLVDRAAAGL